MSVCPSPSPRGGRSGPCSRHAGPWATTLPPQVLPPWLRMPNSCHLWPDTGWVPLVSSDPGLGHGTGALGVLCTPPASSTHTQAWHPCFDPWYCCSPHLDSDSQGLRLQKLMIYTKTNPTASSAREEGQTAWMDPADSPETPPDLQCLEGSWLEQAGALLGAGSVGQELAVAQCHGGAVGHTMCQHSHLASLPAARLIPAPPHSPWLPLSSADGRGDLGEGGGERRCCCREGQASGSLVALPVHPPTAPGPRPQPGREEQRLPRDPAQVSGAGWDGSRMDLGWFWDGSGRPWVPTAALLSWAQQHG